jgi:hypothetical protein
MKKNLTIKKKGMFKEIEVVPTMHLKRFDALMWLLDPREHRRTGRSYTLAVVYINLAMKYPGEWITVCDHFPTHDADVRLVAMIKAGIRTWGKVGADFSFRSNAIRCGV